MVEVTNGNNCKATSLATDVNSAANQPSVIAITSPVANTTVVGTITISADISDPDGTIIAVEYLDGNTVIGSSTTAPYSYDWTTPGGGSHVITVRVTDSNGGVTTSAPVTVTSSSISTGVTNGNNAYANVYPIPARDEVIVETEIDLTNAQVKVTNALGEEVSLSTTVQGKNAQLNVSGLADGAYILLITEDSNIITKKIIIAH
ncbi:Ig-like domain-containing protein [Cytophaga aurantiaca]|uniref:Ig-like domain-containing protein n=1 Tax=Cytophaga aurantiaca TaxID=29530 RepID=UPI003CCB7FBF